MAVLVRLVMKSIWKENKRRVKHIGSKSFGIQFLPIGIYTHRSAQRDACQSKNGLPSYVFAYLIWHLSKKPKRKPVEVEYVK